MSVVYRAEDTKLRRPVALKFLPPALTADDGAKRRFVLEAQADVIDVTQMSTRPMANG